MTMRTLLTLTALLLAPQTELPAAESTFQPRHLVIGLSPSALALSLFAVDSLGQGELDQDPVLLEANAIAGDPLRRPARFGGWWRGDLDCGAAAPRPKGCSKVTVPRRGKGEVMA